MQPWMKRGFFAAGIVIALWCMMVLYWRTTNRVPATLDLLAGLLALPAAFLATIWLLRKSASGVSELGAQPASAAPDAPHVQLGLTSTQLQALHPCVSILCAAIRSPHASTVDALTDALVAGEARLTLDPELKNQAGMPVRAGRVTAIDTDLTADAITAWSLEYGLHLPHWIDEHLRCLAMGGEVCAELAGQLTSHPLLAAYRDSALTNQSNVPLPQLRVVSIWPQNWHADIRRLGDAWLLHQIEQAGWPPEKTMLDTRIENAPGTALGHLERIAKTLHQQGQACICLLVACDSAIGASTILAWEQTGELTTRHGAGGLVPGEGAAGLLLAAGPSSAELLGETTAFMYPVMQGRRAKSADRGGVVSDPLLETLARQASLAASLELDQIGLLVADTDQRSTRVAELAALGSSLLPELDLREACFQVAAACGAAGSASTLTALALAWQGAASGMSSLCISNQDAFDCAVAAVRPTAAPPT